MTLSDLTSREAVLEAIREYEELGRDAFLTKYGFGESKRYYIEVDGKRYDSKAIAGVAVGKQHPQSGYLQHNSFSGGIAAVGRKLTQLGFKFVDRLSEGPDQPSIGDLLANAMAEFAIERATPFQTKPRLWDAMNAVKHRLETFEAVQSRPHISCHWSLGAGNWLKIPWIALFDDRVTKSAQSGIYFVLLVSEDLSRVYLTLNQGATEVKKIHGLAGARTVLAQTASQCRDILQEIDTSLLTLSNEVDLRTEHTNSRLYEAGAIAFALHEPIEAMSDDVVEQQLEQLLTAYESVRLANLDKAIEDFLTREAVEAAMDECDQLGITSFLERYGFGRPKMYWTRRDVDGTLYPAKATVGAAYRFAPGGRALSAKEFHSGFGEQAANATLEKLGFEVVNVRDKTTSVSEEYAPQPTNLILHGPPGTGKTYATAEEAVRLCLGSTPSDRDELMEVYHALHRKGRISFVTFHQSYSYEEFVEGLRPDTGVGDENVSTSGGFSLTPHDGVFKQIATLAGENRGAAVVPEASLIDRSQKIFKMSLGRSWAAEDDVIYQDALENGYVVLGWGGDVDWSDTRFDDWEAIKKRWREDHPDASGNDPNMSQMYAFRINMQLGSLVVISDGNRKFRAIGRITGPYEFIPGPNGEYNHRRSVDWLWHADESLPRERIYGKSFSQVSAYQLNSRQIDWDALEQIVRSGGESSATSGIPEPYVLIIDEINRANISKVFGELITLLEPDKRIGAQNELRVRLPYSGEIFGVPSNLHIIGTMNTADRSIALLDTALRRRFIFRELMPNSEVLPATVDGIPLRKIFERLNKRIEYLFDREHQIGHAYFLGCETRQHLDDRMRYRVIPLLTEYFYEDWGKVAAVLGDDEGKRFLEREELKAPSGLDSDGDAPPRIRWSVRTPFSNDAYSTFT